MMAGRHIPHPPVAVVLVSVVLLSGYAAAQELSNEATDHGPADSPIPQKDTLEETVIAEMLRIVDQKFDSLSARISVLERSVNSLNFYSVRQFREISESLAVSTAAMNSLSGHLGKVDKDSRALKAVVSQTAREVNVIRTDVSNVKTDVKIVKADVGSVKTEVNVLKSDSLKMFDDIANSIVYFNENAGERTDELKSMVRQVLSTVTDKDTDSVDNALIISYLQDMDLSRPRNCTVNFRPLEERIDLRFAEMKRQTHIHFVDLINAGDNSDSEEEEEEEEEDEGPKALRQVAEKDPGSLEVTEEGGGSERGGGGSRGKGGREGERDGEKVMRLLANMTQNVMEAVSYFRHTGSMIEQLLHTTYTMKEEQSRLRHDIVEASRLLSSGHTEGAEGLFEDVVSHVPEGGDLNSVPGLAERDSDLALQSQEEDRNNLPERSNSVYPAAFPLKNSIDRHPALHVGSVPSYIVGSQGGPPSLSPEGGVGMREVAEESLRVLSELTKNGTQLLEVLTEMAQLSSTTLTQSVATLQTQIQKLEEVQVSFSEGLPGSSLSGDVSKDQKSSSGLVPESEVRSLQNTTKTIFSIVEAIASNTGWIPYIFHNMQHVERIANRTFELAKRTLLTPRPHRNEIPGSLAPEKQLGGRDSISQGQALDLIYDTNVKLQRIMPALTKLVAEPEPLVALAEGSSSQEGRVEIFYKGQWGSVCRLDMGHSEASTVCKHLGFAGGVWAGADEFGRGSEGRHWLLNTTCLHSQLCPLVLPDKHTVDCPSGHFSVVCDHMLRMVAIPGLNDIKTGLVSIHHRGRWLPVCSHGWSGYEARVACKQMGFLDGREFLQDDLQWREVLGEVSTWVAGVGCTGEEIRLDACDVDTFAAKECPDTDTPAAVRCQ